MSGAAGIPAVHGGEEVKNRRARDRLGCQSSWFLADRAEANASSGSPSSWAASTLPQPS
jgi:hypothetical protein